MILEHTTVDRNNGAHHFVASADEDGHCARVGALLDDHHLVACCTKGDLAHDARGAQLFRREVFETGNNTAVCRDRNKLYRIQTRN